MGFYGNITNTNKTQFTFDKIYENRRQMDLNVTTDGIYIGRYVLIDYGVEGEIKPWTVLFINPETEHFLFAAPNVDAEGNTKYFEETRALYTENGSYGHYVNKGEIIYVDNAKTGMKDFYICSGFVEEAVGDINQKFAVFEYISEEETDVLPSNYTLNYNIDRKVYDPNNSGRGFDSTVWQKVYVEEEGIEGEKYVMIAELNSVVPTFDIAVDAPSIEPITPHFDANSTDVYYRLHLQPQWGVRVRAADPYEAAKDENTMKKTGYYDYARSVVDFDWSNYKSKLPSDTKVNTSITKYNPATGKDEESRGNYDGAIYFNRAGFDVDKRYRSTDDYSTTVDNEISIRPLGASGQKYTIHRPGDMNPTEGYKLDIQEFVMMLPSLGDTICDLWDLAYGDWTFAYEDDGVTIKKDEFDNPIITYKEKRNTDVSWGNKNGLRMVKRAQNGNGFTYDPLQVSTLAGCINSVHDLMGAIIIGASNEDLKPAIGDALTNHIYYGNFEYDPTNPATNGKKDYYSYYVKYPKIYLEKLDEKGLEELKNSNKVISLTQFKEKEYYYTAEKNWYLELTDRYLEGTNYYKKNDVVSMFDSIELVGGYKPKRYHYQNETKDYICELEPKPDSSKTYYYIASFDAVPITNVDNNVFLYNPPEEHSVTGEDEEGNPTYTGYFYYNAEKTAAVQEKYPGLKVYTKVVAGMKFNKDYKYFIGTDYTIESEISIGGDPFETYNFASVKEDNTIDEYGKLTPVTFISFYPNGNPDDAEAPADNYYEKVVDTINEVTNYIRLQSNEDIKDGVDYYKVTPTEKANAVTPFYQPEKYYAKNINGDYLLSREDDKIDDLSYFIKNDTIISPTKEVFYIANRYYYENPAIPGEFILDVNEYMTPGRKYFLRKFAYVMEDKRGILQPGSKWNVNITEIPTKEDGTPLVTLGERIEETPEQCWEWRELDGFAKDLNTIHGLIVQLQYKLKSNDLKTRDNATVQGCINIMNDIINSFGTLVPKEIMIVDEYGRMTSSPYTTNQTYATTHIVNDNPIKTIVPEKTGKEIEALIEKADSDYEKAVAEIKADTSLTQEEIDIKIAELEQSYKEQVEAYEKSLQQWISIEISDDVIQPSIHIYHEYHPKDGSVTNVDLNDGTNNFLSYKPIVDSTGHVVGHDYENITLPFGYKFFNCDSGSVAAINTQDTMAILGDNWINTQAISNEDGTNSTITISHKAANEVEASPLQDEFPKFGDAFIIEDWYFDSNGHMYTSKTHTVTIPKGSQTETESNTNAQVITSIKLTPDTGLIENTYQNVGTLLLTGYESIDINKADYIQATDTLNAAFKKLNTGIKNIVGGAGDLLITNYQALNEPASTVLAATDTINIAFGKLEYKINAEKTRAETAENVLTTNLAAETARADAAEKTLDEKIAEEKKRAESKEAELLTAISSESSRTDGLLTGLSYDDTEATVNKIVTKVTQTNGKIAVTHSNAGTLLLTDYVIGTSSDDIASTDTINGAFGKLQKQIKSVQELIGVTSVSAQIKASETATQALIPKIASQPTTAGYYILKVNEDGSSNWITVDYTPVNNGDET